MTDPTEVARSIAANAVSLLDAAYGCRASGLDSVSCAPILLDVFPTTTALQMATALSLGWAGIINNSIIETSLLEAKYSQSGVTSARTATLISPCTRAPVCPLTAQRRTATRFGAAA